MSSNYLKIIIFKLIKSKKYSNAEIIQYLIYVIEHIINSKKNSTIIYKKQ